MTEHRTRYRLYSEYLQQKYGEKVNKLPINLPGTCPNRDGKVGWGGCIYCDEEGAGFECLSNTLSIKQQLTTNKDFFTKRFKAQKFIAYFQAFTNTYWPFEDFCANIRAVADDPDLVGIAISTRPDCVNDRYLDFLKQIGSDHQLDISLELGLQTVNYHTLKKINRGHTLAEFIDAMQRIKARGLETCIHLILNLPWDNLNDSIENAKIISVLGVSSVKLHSLYIVEGTPLAEMYLRGDFQIIPLAEYVERVVAFLEYLDPGIVIQRLVGKGPQEQQLFCNWGASWWKIAQEIEQLLESRDTCQGKKFDYLNGKALR